MEMALSTKRRPLEGAAVLAALRALHRGDFSARLPLDLTGLSAEIAEAFNDLAEQNEELVRELERTSGAVGGEGKTDERASLTRETGRWGQGVRAVNTLIDDLVHPNLEVGRVLAAVVSGDLTQRIAVGNERPGPLRATAASANALVALLASLTSQVTHVAVEVGTLGNFGGKVELADAAGAWSALAGQVNTLVAHLRDQVRDVSRVIAATKSGDLTQQMTVEAQGEVAELKATLNGLVGELNQLTSEVIRVGREVGTEGKLGGRAQRQGPAGTWSTLTDSVNQLVDDLSAPLRDIAEVTEAVARGDLSRRTTIVAHGDVLRMTTQVDGMVAQLDRFATEVERVAHEVGTAGVLGGQADVPGAAGTWRQVTEQVNALAATLTSQVRRTAAVISGVAKGDFRRQLRLEARGEVAELAEGVNEMIGVLALVADQVTTVAREVGVEGKLGGQARVPLAAGRWREVTDHVNHLAAIQTTQVRAIAEVVTAVTQGDLSRAITVDAPGELAALKDNINQMILALKVTTEKNLATDWLKTSLVRFTRMLHGQRNLIAVAQMILSELAQVVSVQRGAFYVMEGSTSGDELRLLASYAVPRRPTVPTHFAVGEGLVGQCAHEKSRILLTHVPANYVQVTSGLGSAPPNRIVLLPVLFEGDVLAVIELATFEALSDIHLTFLEKLTDGIGIVLHTLSAHARTEELLKQSQTLTTDLQMQQWELKASNGRLEQQAATLRQSEERLRAQQDELRHTNEQLEEKAALLARKKAKIEAKNIEIVQAGVALEQKAHQLALASNYKSQFLANMSHELRTPLNSLLILARLLADNDRGNLSPKQVEFARTIHAAGSDLLSLINEILDLSKIESGTMSVDLSRVSMAELRYFAESVFRVVALEQGLAFEVEIAPEVPPDLETDVRRLQQVIRNLLSNAFKFTSDGSVTLRVALASSGWSADHPTLGTARHVLAVTVIDTGLGIALDKQRLVFEAFQQADSTTSRLFGGTGLGLSISREIAQLLGGELSVESVLGTGSAFTLYLPQPCPAPRVPSIARSVAPKSVVPASGESPALAGRRVLVVDDDMRNLYALTSVLEQQQMEVRHTTNGTDAIQLLQEEPEVDVVLMDLMMPGLDGYEAIRAIRQFSNFKSTPIIALTAKAMHGDRETCLQAGATDYLAKPVDTRQLVALLARHLEHRP